MQENGGDPKTISTTDARAGRIVKGGAMQRTLWVSLALAVAAMIIAYLLFLR